MIPMRRPFVVRVESDDAVLAECIARAVEPALAGRGAKAHVIMRPRALPGASIVVAVWDEGQGARWLAPIEVPTEPLDATAHVIRFLEEWGFIPAAPAKAAER